MFLIEIRLVFQKKPLLRDEKSIFFFLDTELRQLKFKINCDLFVVLQEYYKLRCREMAHLKSTEGAASVYPHKFHVSTSMTDYIEKYSYLKAEEVSEDKVSLAGKQQKNKHKNRWFIKLYQMNVFFFVVVE